jgi:hypothetical protein
LGMSETPEPESRPQDRTPSARALPRPGMNLSNRLAMAVTRWRQPRQLERSELDRWVGDSIATMSALGADDATLKSVRNDSKSWIISSESAPEEVWCGEIKWPPVANEKPKTFIYPDSPWGRLPSRRLFDVGGQTSIIWSATCTGI